jgi:3'-phosphoadenosine 5'-phosphosulfate sulfotransferase (PAPS reductase)/FAD synthetase
MNQHLQNLVDETLTRAEYWLREFRNPVVLWSGGKDSTAMLHLLIFKLGVRLPCVQWREPRFRHRYAHSDLLAREWDLTLFDYAPGRIAIQDGFDIETGQPRFDFLKYYQWGHHSALVLSLGTEHPKEGEPYLCGLTDVLQRPTGSFNWPWDAAFHGQKSADVDLIKGGVPLAQDVRRVDDSPTQLFLMRHWTDDDIFDYLEAEGVPMDPTRYDRASGKWGHKQDKSSNADYYPICWNCVNRHLSAPVWCPKLRSEVNSIAHLAPYEDNAIPEQGFKPTWNPNTTVNGVAHVARTVGAGPCSSATAPTPPASLPNTSAPTTPCSRQTHADAASPSVARWAEESPAQYIMLAHPPAGPSSLAAHSA